MERLTETSFGLLHTRCEAASFRKGIRLGMAAALIANLEPGAQSKHFAPEVIGRPVSPRVMASPSATRKSALTNK